jgi:hypothetical protein
MATTERDCEVMERLLQAVNSGEVATDEEWRRLAARLHATEAHLFAVLMMLGGRLPWKQRGRGA